MICFGSISSWSAKPTPRAERVGRRPGGEAAPRSAKPTPRPGVWSPEPASERSEQAPSPALFVELGAGTAAVTLALVGGLKAKPPTTMQGSKRGFVEAVLRAAGLAPGGGAKRVALVESGPWSSVYPVAYRPGGGEAVASAIGKLTGKDRTLWERLRKEGPGRGATRDAAAVLYLQAREYKNKPVRWDKSSGFNPEFRLHSARAATSHSGTQYVPRPVLQKRARALEEVRWPVVDTWKADARSLDPMRVLAKARLRSGRGVVVYLDPPYANRTQGYVGTMTRAEVVTLALRWAKTGATVILSESEPIVELRAKGWATKDITNQYVGRHRPFTSDTREWLTIHRGIAA